VIRCIVGLGNPGPHYARTRHNIGFMVLDAMVQRAGLEWRKRWWHPYWHARMTVPHPVLCCKPATYMNRSGKAVYAVKKKYRLAAEEILVVYDDVHLPVGKIRFRSRGSAGGHNGMASIIDWLGTDTFPRLRIGIGDGGDDRIAHVLSPFDEAEQDCVEQVIAFAADAVPGIPGGDVQQVMQTINSWHAPRSTYNGPAV
jgi:PTH1 family peptidyl-tRNA hydrolase